MAALPTSNLSDTIMQEFQFVKVPFEHYKNTIRPNNRSVKKGISSVISAVDSVSLNDDTVSHLSSLVSRLHGLKRKVLRSTHLFVFFFLLAFMNRDSFC